MLSSPVNRAACRLPEPASHLGGGGEIPWQVPHSSPDNMAPLHTISEWHRLGAPLFMKQPYYFPGCDLMITAKDALARSKANDFDRWVGGAHLSARERILKQVVVPVGRQSFSCKPGDTFFAIGSCFARNVEERLELSGAEVLSRKMNVRDLGDTGGRTLGIFNKYTPLSILQELQFAAGERPFPVEAFLPVRDGLFYDSQLRVNSGDATIDALSARRAEINTAFAQVFKADVVILTLGLIEAWYDHKTDLYLTEMPAPRLIAQEPDRFGFKCLSLDDCTRALQEIHGLLARHGKPGQKVIVTVSPVALGRTFSEDDIIVANMTSKSTLRVAAMEFADAHTGIDYFPSYETVMNSAPSLAWQEDRLHASDFIVGRIIGTFLERYGLVEATEAAMQNDGVAETAEQELISRLRRDVDKYKNRILALEKQLQQAKAGSDGMQAG
ncbi:GSCFA domain-containing protein [Gemmobacter lanyuensis]